MTTKNKQHKWHKEIKAWADGAEIEYYSPINDRWYLLETQPEWCDDFLYRIKPQPKEPQYLYVYEDSYYSPDDKDTRASTRIMSKRIRDWECNYIGKIKLEGKDETN